MLALPLLLAMPARAEPTVALAAALVVCWQARGVRFTPAQVAARIGGKTGRAALAAVAGAWTDASDDDQETMVEIVWEAGRPPSPAAPLLDADLAAGRPALLLASDGQWWLLIARDRDRLGVRDPISGEARILAMTAAELIGRPVIAGA
ncbi:MAG: hypothetical protein ACOYO0_05355 [Sandarakinorhabdus sp.]